MCIDWIALSFDCVHKYKILQGCRRHDTKQRCLCGCVAMFTVPAA